MGGQTQVRSVVAVLVLSVGAGGTLAWTVPQPDRHPFVFALGLSWILACVGGATCQVFCRLDPMWFRAARWERNGRIYEWVGVKIFRWILLHTPLGWLGPLAVRPGRSGLDGFLREMNSVEGRHAVAALLSLAAAAGYVCGGHRAIATWLVLITIPLNIYPVALQRWNRARVLQLRGRVAAARRPDEGPLGASSMAPPSRDRRTQNATPC